MRTSERDVEFVAFVEAHSARLLVFATLLAGDAHRAQDLLQSVLLRTYTRWPRIRQDDPVGYVRRGLINANHDWLRRRATSDDRTGVLPDAASTDDHADDLANRDAVIRALATLTSRERAVVVLRYYEDQSEASIAATLGIARGTVKSTGARALKKLRIEPSLQEADRS